MVRVHTCVHKQEHKQWSVHEASEDWLYYCTIIVRDEGKGLGLNSQP